MLSKTETLKFQEMGKMRLSQKTHESLVINYFLFCFDICLFPQESYSCLLRSSVHVYFCGMHFYFFYFFKFLQSKWSCFAETCFIVTLHPVLIYSCSCIAFGGFLSSAAV